MIPPPTITVDFRPFDFTTLRELDALTADMLREFSEDMPDAKVAEIIISERQLKQLRFDWYMHGTPEKICKKKTVQQVRNVEVTVSEFDEGCPNCGGDLDWH